MKEHYHFIGIGGIGVGGLALLLLEKGVKVSGSDVSENAITRNLKAKGAQIFLSHNAENIQGATQVIYSSAINADNAELGAARQRHVPVRKRAELLAELMNDHIGVTVAGAHGKTTTTSIVAGLLVKAGLGPTSAIGGIVNATSSNAHWGKGRYFVAEVDESDGSFLYFNPTYSIITNIDKEHLDHYGDFESIIRAYRSFIDRTKTDGLIIACGDDSPLSKIISQSQRKHMTYGLSSSCDMRAENIVYDKYKSSFDCLYRGKRLGRAELSIPGIHNVTNSLAAIGLGLALSINPDIIFDNLRSFKGVQRRFQVRSKINGVTIIDDYGHHPTEIKMTLGAAQTAKEKRLVVVFQPHRYSRLKYLLNDFAQSLCDCDHLIITDVYAASEKPIEGVNALQLVQEIKKLTNIPVQYVEKKRINEYLTNELMDGDLLLMLGAGDIIQISEKFANEFSHSDKVKN